MLAPQVSGFFFFFFIYIITVSSFTCAVVKNLEIFFPRIIPVCLPMEARPPVPAVAPRTLPGQVCAFRAAQPRQRARVSPLSPAPRGDSWR